MKILHISTNDYGGAGTAALRIHKAFLQAKYTSIIMVKRKESDVSGVFQIGFGVASRVLGVLRAFLRIFLFRENYFMYGAIPNFSAQICNKLEEIDFHPDIVMVHWNSGFVEKKELLKIQTKFKSKMLFYFMDMANFTGGCHFSNGCSGYQQGCNKCPADRLKLNHGLPNYTLNSKISLMRSISAIPVSPNNFVASQSNNSIVFSIPSFVAYIPIPNDIFFPIHSSFVENSKVVILFGSPDLTGGRKGGDLFLKMLKIFDRRTKGATMLRRIEVLVPGLNGKFEDSFENLSIISCRRAKTEKDLSSLYQNSDFFVCCSRQDSGPMMLSESLMSGTPVLTFDVGIASELVVDNVNGFVVDMEDVHSMAEKLVEICNYNDESFSSFRLSARASAIKKISPEAFISSFETIKQ